MTRRPPFTVAGNDVALVGRRADGRARVAYLDGQGRPTGGMRSAWPHEIRRIGMHLAAIKAAIAALPRVDDDGNVVVPPPQPRRGWLFVDHAIKED